MKILITLTFAFISILSFGQTASNKPKTGDDLGHVITTDPPHYEPPYNERKVKPVLKDASVLKDSITITLQPYQKQILLKLDSVQKDFAVDVEKNKDVIATFNALMQRSASIQERSKDAQDLIFGDHGIDPKKYRISGGDLIKGTLKIERIKELTFPNGASINK